MHRSFEKTVDDLKLEMSEPSPRWVTITAARDGSIRGLQIEQLRDLRYLIDCAIAFAEQDEARVRRT